MPEAGALLPVDQLDLGATLSAGHIEQKVKAGDVGLVVEVEERALPLILMVDLVPLLITVVTHALVVEQVRLSPPSIYQEIQGRFSGDVVMVLTRG